MTGILLPRRQFLAGLVGLIAAPAIVKAASLMPVRRVPIENDYDRYVDWFRRQEPLPVPADWHYVTRISLPGAEWRALNGKEFVEYITQENEIIRNIPWQEIR